MKMAKASAADLQMAIELVGLLEAIERGHVPDPCCEDADGIEWLDTDDGEQCGRIIEALLDHLRKGSIGRVVWGMSVVCDPENELIDPEARTIEHHPARVKAEAALLWTLYHHQGGGSPIGQPIRKLLGIGQFDRLNDEQLAQAKAFAETHDALIQQPVSAALADVIQERKRQVEVEGWTPEHDDRHNARELSAAAESYAGAVSKHDVCPAIWPWDEAWWKPKDYRRNLVKAGAMILAEIERLDRISDVPTGNLSV